MARHMELRKRAKKIRRKFILDMMAGPREKKILDFIHKSGAEKKYEKVKKHYIKEIVPVLIKGIMRIPIDVDREDIYTSDCWASFNTPIIKPKNLTDILNLIENKKLYITVCNAFILDSDFPGLHPMARFASEEKRWQQLEDSIVHELNHAVDYLWASDAIKYPGKPELSPDESILNVKTRIGVNLDPDDYWMWHKGAKGFSTQQSEILQKAYKLTILTTNPEDIGADPFGAGPYNRRAVEIYANLQSIIWTIGELRLEDLKLLCKLKRLCRLVRIDGGDMKGYPETRARWISRYKKIRHTLEEKGWPSHLLGRGPAESRKHFEKKHQCKTQNMFITFLDCTRLNKEVIKDLNQIANIVPAKEFKKFVIDSSREREYAE